MSVDLKKNKKIYISRSKIFDDINKKMGFVFAHTQCYSYYTMSGIFKFYQQIIRIFRVNRYSMFVFQSDFADLEGKNVT